MRLIPALITLLALAEIAGQAQPANAPVRFAIIGLAHDHAGGFIPRTRDRDDVQLAGIVEPKADLVARYAERFKLATNLFFPSLESLLARTNIQAVATFTSTFEHKRVVELCAPRGIHVMMEKPLAVSMEHAHRIEQAARRGGIQVIVNFETTWYRSHGAIWNLIKQQHAAGEIRKMVAMDGHQGPQEIHVQPEFLAWLTDPVKNGAGALFDFGCYGANLMTWLMDNQRPLSVTAITQTFKPQIYSRVDDEATILVEYPKAQGIIEGSWNWPYSRKDLEVYAERGSAIAIGGNELRVRLPDQRQEEIRTPAELPPDEQNSVSYLMAVVRGKLKPSGLSSLENNLIVTEILTAARESARTGKRVAIARH